MEYQFPIHSHNAMYVTVVVPLWYLILSQGHGGIGEWIHFPSGVSVLLPVLQRSLPCARHPLVGLFEFAKETGIIEGDFNLLSKIKFYPSIFVSVPHPGSYSLREGLCLSLCRYMGNDAEFKGCWNFFQVIC